MEKLANGHFRLRLLKQQLIKIKREENQMPTYRNVSPCAPELVESQRRLKGIEAQRQQCLNEIAELEKIEMQYKNLCVLKDIDFDCVLSFNYTNTFDSLYGNKTEDGNNETKFCYIHGKAQLNRDETKMILGIDESLKNDEADSQFTFAQFKKYFQRIFYKTGSEYKDWIKKMNNLPENMDDVVQDEKHEVYVIGHSLGRTDHEVLKEFFNIRPEVKITIFYHDEISKINVIERTIEMIGKEEVIRRVHGEDWTIRFIDQHDEKDGILNHPDKVKHKIFESKK